MEEGGFLLKFNDKEITRCYSVKLDYDNWKYLLKENKIEIEKEIKFGNSKSIYFRDPVGNVVELITNDAWPVDV